MNNTSIQLRTPTLEMKEDSLRYRKEHFDYDEHIIYGSELFDQISSYEEWLDIITKNTQATSVSPDWVITDTFFAMSQAQTKL